MSTAPSSPPRNTAPAAMANLDAPPPPAHRHSHHSSQRLRPEVPRRKSDAAHRHHRSLSATAATSPEVINSLVDSLSKLSPSPLHNPALYGSLAPPEPEDAFPGRNGPVPDIEYEGGFLHPDDAALAPVVRTSKPPSGYSPHTSMDFDAASKRSSYHSGMGVGKGGVDLSAYMRGYMNRAPGERDSTSVAERMVSRESSFSGKSGRKLSYVSSRERMRIDKTERDRELRASAAEILAGSGKDIEKAIPKRSSSYGKGSPRKASTFPMAILTNTTPLVKSPLASPGLPPPDMAEDYDGEESAPAPELPRKRHRNSKNFHSNTGLPAAIAKRRASAEKIQSPASGSNQAKRQSEPTTTAAGGILSHFQPNAAPRPSFHSESYQAPYERPSSSDSIDDAVDSYLCSPRLSQKLRVPNSDRVISFSEVGDPSGFAVFVCVGMGLTRYVTAFYDELAMTLGLRLITPDRPGVGESSPIEEAERTVLNWPDDVLFICQSLKITKFSILAHSAGAIYALATALRMPGHIRGKIHLLAPWIPPSQMENIKTKGENGEKTGKVGTVPTSQRILRALPTPMLKVANSSFMSATSSSLTSSLPKNSARRTKKRSTTPAPKRDADKTDKMAALANVKLSDDEPNVASPPRSNTSPAAMQTSNPTSPTDPTTSLTEADLERQAIYDSRLISSIWSLATRNANPAVDLLVCLERNRPVGFRYVDITREVVIHHGAKDTRVPLENVRWLGKTMRKCELRVLTDEGHGLMASAKVMGGVLEEIAREWREWRHIIERKGRGRGEERVWAA